MIPLRREHIWIPIPVNRITDVSAVRLVSLVQALLAYQSYQRPVYESNLNSRYIVPLSQSLPEQAPEPVMAAEEPVVLQQPEGDGEVVSELDQGAAAPGQLPQAARASQNLPTTTPPFPNPAKPPLLFPQIQNPPTPLPSQKGGGRQSLPSSPTPPPPPNQETEEPQSPSLRPSESLTQNQERQHPLPQPPLNPPSPNTPQRSQETPKSTPSSEPHKNQSQERSPLISNPPQIATQVRIALRFLRLPEFSTQAQLLLASNQTLTPQSVTMLKELLYLETSLMHLAEANRVSPQVLGKVSEQLCALEYELTDVLIPKLPGQPQRLPLQESFSFRVESLKKQIDILIFKEPLEIEKKPSRSEVFIKPPLSSVSNFERAPSPTEMKEQKSVFPQSLKFAEAAKNREELADAVKKLEVIERKQGQNPIIMIPFPFDQKSDDIRNFRSQAPGKAARRAGGFEEDDEMEPMAFIPQGSAIIGDAEHPPIRKVEVPDFLIALVPVTNSQFAWWLTQKYLTGQITFKEGVVWDSGKTALCTTYEGTFLSQIRFQPPNFIPLEGDEDHPVVNVSWFGAQAFCEDSKVRLPTEVEWEKAASMGKEKKYLFGCSGDFIDQTLANYHRDGTENWTTPVGFYNGINTFHQGDKKIETHLSMSPYGCYDMSGNVWEWTADSEEGHTIAKGGSYHSLGAELKCAARRIADPYGMFADIGFRVAIALFESV